MQLIQSLQQIRKNNDTPFFIADNTEIKFSSILDNKPTCLNGVKAGDVVALIGDFDVDSISILLYLIELNAIIMPLTKLTTSNHENFFKVANVDIVIDNCKRVDRYDENPKHPLIQTLKKNNHAGLILFSTGTTGKQKAILHDLTLFLSKFDIPNTAMKTLSFLLFDHIGGINTLFHNLFNNGTIIAVRDRTLESILYTCKKYNVEALPTTPTFLRMLLMSGAIPDSIPKCIKIITYGTERMDQGTLDIICNLLPNVYFKQNFGISELGVLQVKSESRNSLYMKIVNKGVDVKVIDNALHIRSPFRMLGYLNANDPFYCDGWYNTGDIVEEKNGMYKIVGRENDVVNVAGLKFTLSEVERVALQYPGVAFVKVSAPSNPITGQHVELSVQPQNPDRFSVEDMMVYMKKNLQSHMTPKRIKLSEIAIGHRFKQL